MPEVKEAIEQISKEPIEQILKRKEHNFRALKQEQRIINMKGNKWLQELAQIEKDYSKTLKKPVLVIRLNSEDFE